MQIINGSVIGSVVGSLWFYLLTVVTPLFASLETVAPFSWFYFKDTSHIDDVLKFEFDAYRMRRAQLKTDAKSTANAKKIK